jgi:hypothetical protein
MRLPKKDDATRLIDVIRSEQKELSGLERKLASTKPAWEKQHRLCCELGALRTAHDAVYTRPAEVFFRQFGEALTQERDEAIAKRDSLIGDLPGQIRTLRERIYQRMSLLSSTLGSFISAVVGQCSPQLQEELLAARRQADEMTDPAALLDLIRTTAERVEDEDLQSIPLLKLDSAVQRVLAIGEEVPNSNAVA